MATRAAEATTAWLQVIADEYRVPLSSMAAMLGTREALEYEVARIHIQRARDAVRNIPAGETPKHRAETKNALHNALVLKFWSET